MKSAAIIVAAGSGSRMGRPKQFLPLGDTTVVECALKTFLQVSEIETIILVLNAEHVKEQSARLSSGRVKVIEGGATRMGSVRNGFRQIPRDISIVAVHDGARSLITPDIIRATIQQAYKSGAALPAVPVKDTLKQVDGKDMWVLTTPDRSVFWAAQTPQCYRREILEKALTQFPEDKDATDESQLVEKSGCKVKIVMSTYENFKITTPEDLIMAHALMEERSGGRRHTRVGFGFDIHRLAAGRALWLAGIQIAHDKGLVGHSDGDAVLHAAGDAVLGALGAGEIGLMFPPENMKIKGIASREIAAAVLEKLKKADGVLTHLDVTLIAEEPKLKPHYEAMKASLAACFAVPVDRVNLKAKSNEGLDAIGRGEAIACHAVATVLLPH